MQAGAGRCAADSLSGCAKNHKKTLFPFWKRCCARTAASNEIIPPHGDCLSVHLVAALVPASERVCSEPHSPRSVRCVLLHACAAAAVPIADSAAVAVRPRLPVCLCVWRAVRSSGAVPCTAAAASRSDQRRVPIRSDANQEEQSEQQQQQSQQQSSAVQCSARRSHPPRIEQRQLTLLPHGQRRVKERRQWKRQRQQRRWSVAGLEAHADQETEEEAAGQRQKRRQLCECSCGGRA